MAKTVLANSLTLDLDSQEQFFALQYSVVSLASKHQMPAGNPSPKWYNPNLPQMLFNDPPPPPRVEGNTAFSHKSVTHTIKMFLRNR